MILPTALILTVAAALLVYLGSPRQNWLRIAWPRWTQAAALVPLLAGAALWCREAGVGAGLFAVMTCIMLIWVLAPYVGWWLGHPSTQERRR
ncbi:hypothetical protein [Oleiagrimonas soli]|uniref:Transmembrane protein n=1 Tax=Oleiagrimonas soli TaxID=1543381 RepID=A0A099CRR6_9GAMM|nr:hypothetical protein [Oleiagrimonas soli]KGI76693.1 hypothetical protein LF63_0114095 [Oleiagrimonas soli]MBB6185085.1 hypothetical protein [Oleiagrimonas soli]